jgi:hypothetical protein
VQWSECVECEESWEEGTVIFDFTRWWWRRCRSKDQSWKREGWERQVLGWKPLVDRCGPEFMAASLWLGPSGMPTLNVAPPSFLCSPSKMEHFYFNFTDCPVYSLLNLSCILWIIPYQLMQGHHGPPLHCHVYSGPAIMDMFAVKVLPLLENWKIHCCWQARTCHCAIIPDLASELEKRFTRLPECSICWNQDTRLQVAMPAFLKFQCYREDVLNMNRTVLTNTPSLHHIYPAYT